MQRRGGVIGSDDGMFFEYMGPVLNVGQLEGVYRLPDGQEVDRETAHDWIKREHGPDACPYWCDISDVAGETANFALLAVVNIPDLWGIEERDVESGDEGLNCSGWPF